ncbi:MAG: methyltransferase domain-containing protein [Thermoplasmata archaeon]
MRREDKRRWRRVRSRYDSLAEQASACCDANYAPEELSVVPAESILGLGSGNPVRHAGLQEGEVVADLGSGAGVDVFLAAHQVGPQGRAIGIDMTPAMVRRAREIVEREGVANVEFHESVIEDLPLEDASVDVVLSNCVINLSPDKSSVFREAFQVLRPGGRFVVSDIVQERPLKRVDQDCGCVGNAMVRADYLATILEAGFHDVEVLEDRPWLTGTKGVDASAVTLRAMKPVPPKDLRMAPTIPTDQLTPHS